MLVTMSSITINNNWNYQKITKTANLKVNDPLKARGVVTGGVAWALHLEEVQVFVYLVLVSAVQVVWTQSLQEMHRTEQLYFFGW